MTRCLKFAVLVAAVAFLIGSNCAATTNFPFIGSGSSGVFKALAIGGESSTTPLCVNASPNPAFNWTAASGAIDAEDTRDVTNLVLQKGNVWVEWSTGTSNPSDPPTNICLDIQIDSMVGLRMFFATLASGQPAGVVDIDPSTSCTTLATQAGANLVPLIAADQAGLPSAVCSAIQGLPFNSAPTDIRAEDGQFNTTRVLNAFGTCTTGLGYNGTISGEGVSIQSGISGSPVQPVAFNLVGTDPITGGTLAHTATGIDGKAYVSINGGGQVVLVVVNTTDNTSNGFGETTSTPAFTSINHRVLTQVLTGETYYTRDLLPNGSALATKAFTVLQREPLSGTYTTLDYQGPATQEDKECQEEVIASGRATLVNPSSAAPTGWTGTTNPLDLKNTKTSALKVRVIGTGQMVNTIGNIKCGSPCKDVGGNTLSNQFGYTFFSFGNVAPLTSPVTAKYLLVDGVDPLFTYPDQNPGGVGALPTCTAPCPTAVTLANVENGTYPLWNIVRVVTTGTLGANTNGVCNSGATVCELVANAQTAISEIPDLAPLSAMNVFRSHSSVTLNTGAIAGHNGHEARFPESGSDVQGEVITNEADIDNISVNSAELVNLKL